MSSTLLALIIGVAMIPVILLVRRMRRGQSGGYRRRFDDASTRHHEAFPLASTLYVGDGESASHTHHHHSTDCTHTTDGGN